MEEVNKTKVINILSPSEITKSYDWKDPKTKNMIPASLWVDAIYDYLYNGLKGNSLAKKYTALMPSINKPSHNMYTSSLLRHFEISPLQNNEQIKLNFTSEEMIDWIRSHIDSVAKKVYESAIPRGKKWLDDYFKYQNNREKINIEPAKEVQRLIKAKISINQLNWNYSSVESRKHVVKKVKLSQKSQKHQKRKINFEDFTRNSSQVGEFGEQIVYDFLVSKFGSANVLWMRNIDNSSPYDFEVNNEGKTEYYEVKSTTHNLLRFFMSRNEYEFYKVCANAGNHYSLVSVTNIYLNVVDSLPIINEYVNPKLEVHPEEYGYDQSSDTFYITPSEYIGILS